MDFKTLERIDEGTNDIMDMIRKEFNLNPDSDRDDEIYGYVHNQLKLLIEWERSYES
jgi:hypothetical protein